MNLYLESLADRLTRMRRRRLDVIASGLCRDCKREPHLPGKFVCADCRDRTRKRRQHEVQSP